MCRLWPIFPGRLQPSIFGTAKLNFRVRNGNGWTLCVKITDFLSGWSLTPSLLRKHRFTTFVRLAPNAEFASQTSVLTNLLLQSSCVSVDLFSRAVSSQVFSALQSLTSVFGMGTGGPFALKTLTTCQPNGWRQVCLANLHCTPNLIKVVSIILFTIKSYAHWKPNKVILSC